MLDLQLIRQLSPVLSPPPVLIGYFFISYYVCGVKGQNTHFIPLVKFQLDQWPF